MGYTEKIDGRFEVLTERAVKGRFEAQDIKIYKLIKNMKAYNWKHSRKKRR